MSITAFKDEPESNKQHQKLVLKDMVTIIYTTQEHKTSYTIMPRDQAEASIEHWKKTHMLPVYEFNLDLAMFEKQEFHAREVIVADNLTRYRRYIEDVPPLPSDKVGE